MCRFDHLVLNVPDNSLIIPFLETTLNVRFSQEAKGRVVGFSDEVGLKISIKETGNKPEYSVYDHTAFTCRNLEESWQELIKRNPELTPLDPLQIAPSGRKHLFFKGPNGETWQILQDKTCKELLKFDHVGIKVKSIKETIEYYVKNLGFTPMPELIFLNSKPPLAFLKTSDGFKVELIESPRPSRSGGVFQVIVLKGNIHEDYVGPNGEKVEVN